MQADPGGLNPNGVRFEANGAVSIRYTVHQPERSIVRIT